MKGKLIYIVSLVLFCSQLSCNPFKEISRLPFNETSIEKIQNSITKILEAQSTTLDFSNLENPSQIDRLLELLFSILYSHVNPAGGTIKHCKYRHVKIETINLAGNGLRTIPESLGLYFLELKNVNLHDNPISEYNLSQKQRLLPNIHFTT